MVVTEQPQLANPANRGSNPVAVNHFFLFFYCIFINNIYKEYLFFTLRSLLDLIHLIPLSFFTENEAEIILL